jgi:hypothetical protein
VIIVQLAANLGDPLATHTELPRASANAASLEEILLASAYSSTRGSSHITVGGEREQNVVSRLGDMWELGSHRVLCQADDRTTDLPVEAIANETGYEDASFFRSPVPPQDRPDASTVSFTFWCATSRTDAQIETFERAPIDRTGPHPVTK